MPHKNQASNSITFKRYDIEYVIFIQKSRKLKTSKVRTGTQKFSVIWNVSRLTNKEKSLKLRNINFFTPKIGR